MRWTLALFCLLGAFALAGCGGGGGGGGGGKDGGGSDDPLPPPAYPKRWAVASATLSWGSGGDSIAPSLTQTSANGWTLTVRHVGAPSATAAVTVPFDGVDSAGADLRMDRPVSAPGGLTVFMKAGLSEWNILLIPAGSG